MTSFQVKHLPSILFASLSLLSAFACGSDKAQPEDVHLNLDFSMPDLNSDSFPTDAQSELKDLEPAPDGLTPDTDLAVAELPDLSAPLCTPGERQCQNLLSPAECNPSGTAWIPLNPCSEGYSCYEETGSCGKTVCAPGSQECLDGKTPQKCKFDGSAWDVSAPCGELDVCSGGFCISPGCLHKVMFLVDRSTSMEPNWESVRNSIRNVVQQNPGIQFGLTVFPSSDGFWDACKMDPDLPPVPLQEGAGDLIEAWFNQNDPAGATPLLKAMEWVDDNVATIFGATPENAYIVLLSDGEDKCACSNLDTDPVARAQCVSDDLAPVVQHIASQKVGVFVVGYAYAGPDIELTTIAQNGGTQQTTWINVGSEETLTQAFGDLIDDLKFCM